MGDGRWVVRLRSLTDGRWEMGSVPTAGYRQRLRSLTDGRWESGGRKRPKFTIHYSLKPRLVFVPSRGDRVSESVLERVQSCLI
jgi:hypothetical protein